MSQASHRKGQALRIGKESHQDRIESSWYLIRVGIYHMCVYLNLLACFADSLLCFPRVMKYSCCATVGNLILTSFLSSSGQHDDDGLTWWNPIEPSRAVASRRLKNEILSPSLRIFFEKAGVGCIDSSLAKRRLSALQRSRRPCPISTVP